MADRVHNLRCPATQEELIVRLEELLEDVRAGKVQGATVVYLERETMNVWTVSMWEQWLTGLGALYYALAELERNDEFVAGM